MRLRAKEQVKVLLSQEGIKQKDLAQMLSKKTGHLYSATNHFYFMSCSFGSFFYYREKSSSAGSMAGIPFIQFLASSLALIQLTARSPRCTQMSSLKNSY